MTRGSNTAGLEGLVAGPYRWNGVTYIGFLRDAYDNVIKVEVERLQNIEVEKRKCEEQTNNGKNKKGTEKIDQSVPTVSQNYDVKVAQLVLTLIDESDQVLENENCTDIIGTELWNILKLDEFGKDRYKLDKENDTSAASKKKSVVQLLKFIRNKISHIRTCKGEIKEKLAQFFDKHDNNQYLLNENKFVAFWVAKFPRLIPYLWLKLYTFKAILVNYYPDYDIEIERLGDFLMDTNKFEREIQTSLIADMENGNVLIRFKGPGYLLEFRGFHNLLKILDKNVFIKLTLNLNVNVLLSVSHSSSIKETIEYPGTSSATQKVVIIFTENITDKKVWRCCNKCECRVIVFCDPDKLTDKNIEEAVGKFKYENDLTIELSESPIRGSELVKGKQDWLFENGQVCIQGWNIKIRDIFQDSSSSILKELSGDLLNKLLKQGSVKICENYKYPEYKGVHITRKLYFNCKNATEGGVQSTRQIFGESKFLRRIYKNNVKVVYLLAESGMGKSKLLLSLGKRLKNSLVIFSSFRHFADLLKKRVGTGKMSGADIKFVILEILGCQDECERKLIDKWLEQKCDKGPRIELQLDGLDEVPSGNLELALDILRMIEKEFEVIRLWISSTKPCPKAETEFELGYCSISPLSLTDKVEFFEQACRTRGVEHCEKFVKSYCKILGSRIANYKYLADFLDSPLNCSMVAELYEDNLTSLSSIHMICVNVQLFDSLYEKKFATMFREKNGVTQYDDDDFKMEREVYLQLHTHLALVHLFPQVSHKFPQPLGINFFTNETCDKMGIITNNEPVTFIHLKYADFLVAKYIVRVLKTGKLDNLCSEDLFYDLLCFGSIDKDGEEERLFMWKCLDEYLEEIADWRCLKWLETHKSQYLNPISKDKIGSPFLSCALKCYHWNFARLLITLSVNEQDTSLCNLILQFALFSEVPANWFISMCEKLSFDNQYQLILYSVESGHYETAKYLIESKCGDDVFDKLAETREMDGGILHCIEDRIRYLNKCWKLDRISHGQKFVNLDKFVEKTIDFIRFVHGKSSKEIERKDSCGRNILLTLPVIQTGRTLFFSYRYIFPLKELLVNELNADVNELSFDGERMLSIERDLIFPSIARKLSPQNFSLYRSCKETFDLENVEVYHKTLVLVTSKHFAHINLKSQGMGLTPLQEAVQTFGSKLRRDSLELFRASGANFNALDREGDTILHYCIKKLDSIEFIKSLVNYGCKIYVQNEEYLCALCSAEKVGKVEIIKFFREKLNLKKKQRCKLNCLRRLKRRIKI